MRTVKVQFGSINAVLNFVKIMERESVKADIVGDKMKLSATSFLGLLNMGFYKPYALVFRDDNKMTDDIIDKIKGYIVDK